MPTVTQHLGVLGQHRERLDTDPDYRAAALTAPSIADKTGIHAKYLERTAPTVPANRHDTALVQETGGAGPTGEDIDNLKGDALDKAVADANIEGRSSMSADEKRDALRHAR